MRGHVRTVLIVGLTAGLLTLFLRNANLEQVWVEIERARLDLLGWAVVVTGLTYLVRVFRWQLLLRPIGPTRFVTALRCTVIGFAATSVLPARAGEFLRPYLLARREQLSATATFATIILERLLDLVAVLLLFGTFLLFFDPGMAAVDERLFGAVRITGALAGVGALVVLALVFVLAGYPAAAGRATLSIERVLPAWVARALAELVRKFAEGLAVMRQPGRLLVALVLSFPLWLSIAFAIWLAALAFEIAVPYTGSFLLMALLVVGVSVPTPGFVGGFHVAFQVGATVFYDVPNDRAVGAALLLHAVSFVPVTLLGILFMAQEGLSLSRVRSLAAAGEQTGSPDEAAGGRAANPERAPGDERSLASFSSRRAEDEGRSG